MSKGKIVFLIICAIYLFSTIIAIISGEADAGDLVNLVLFLIVPFVCIWFGEEMGGWIGFSRPLGPRITKSTPGCLVNFVGWLFLLLPFIITIINRLSNESPVPK